MATIVAGSGAGVRRFHTHTTANRTSCDVPFVSTCHGEGSSLLAMIKHWVFVLSRYKHHVSHPEFFIWGGGGVEWSNAAVMCNVCLMLKLRHKIHIIDIAKRSITHSHNLNHQVHTPYFLISSKNEFFILFSKTPIYWSSANFSGCFRLNGKSCNTSDITVSTKAVTF
jgi:hypothetical protein